MEKALGSKPDSDGLTRRPRGSVQKPHDDRASVRGRYPKSGNFFPPDFVLILSHEFTILGSVLLQKGVDREASWTGDGQSEKTARNAEVFIEVNPHIIPFHAGKRPVMMTNESRNDRV